MGGVDKNFDYRILARPIVEHGVRLVILFGANKLTIKKALSKNTKRILVKTLLDAVWYAYQKAQNGDAVLFSPASASFDMFKNSKDRGTVFTKLVRGLAKPRPLC